MNFLKDNRKTDIGIFIIFPVLVFFVSMLTMFDEFRGIHWKIAAVNLIFYELLAWMLFFLSGKGKTALRTELILMWLFGIANAYVYRFRHTYIKPWDLTSVGTAMNVAENYDYTPDARMVISLVAVVILFAAAGICKLEIGREPEKNGLIRMIGTAAAIVLISFMTFLIQKNAVQEILGIYTAQLDSAGMMKKNGMAVNFMYQLKYLSVDKPDSYSADVERDLLKGYVSESHAPEKLPDIIVIMDEALSDPAVDGEFSANIDYMPFIHSILNGEEENTVSGYVNSSVNGGNTPNSEFEFLTGNTMGFLPPGCIAFQQYVKREMDSIPFHLRTLGYQTIATHPYKSSGWDRTKAWPLLGFEETLFQEYFDDLNLQKVRNYISDEAYFGAVADKVDDMNKDGPVFSFNVTMQNHSGYAEEEYGNFERTVSVAGIEDTSVQDHKMTNYLSLIKYTDDAFKKLIDRYRESERPVIIVLYGDHQPDPTTFDVMWDQNHKDRDHLSDEDLVNTYRVPFVIWTNFDIEEKTGIETSINYLGNTVLETAGISLSPYGNFLKEYSEKYPVVSAVRCMNSDGETIMEEKWGDILEDYRRMQYYEMFDDKDFY